MGFDNKGMSLKGWMETTGISRTELADALGVSPTSIVNWMRGDSAPSLQYAMVIERISGGRVGFYDMLTPDDRAYLEGGLYRGYALLSKRAEAMLAEARVLEGRARILEGGASHAEDRLHALGICVEGAAERQGGGA